MESIDRELNMRVEGVLGRGSYATVYYCVDALSRPYAVKVHQLDM